MFRLLIALPGSLLVASCLLGCADSGGPKVNYVEGIVTVDGQPVEGVTVGFSPVAGGTGVAAIGLTDANGKFTLTSTGGGKQGGGAATGEYEVTFIKSEVALPPGTPTSSEDPNYGKESLDEPTTPPQVKHIVPVKYNVPATSGFKATVKEGKNTGDEFKFDLKSQ